jgi:MFS superfamily sulfate permease-like transporter
VKDRQQRLRIFYIVAAGLSIFLLFFKVYAALAPTLIMAAIMLVAAQGSSESPSAFRRYLASKPLSYWVMTWFLFELVVLTAIGTFFRGPGWAWVWPWQSY